MGAAPPASALVNGFEGADGDQACQVALDWSCLPAAWQLKSAVDAAGAGDDVFSGGKEEEPDTWTFQTGAANDKTDITNVWSTAVVPDDEAFLYLAFHRVGGGSGNAFFSFELNQSDVQWRNAQGAMVPCRTADDVLISYELPDTIKLYTWAGSGGPASCPDGASGSWAGPADVAVSRESSVNGAGPIASTLPGSPASTLATNTFGETAVNLAEVAREVGLDSCKDYKGVQAHSRESASLSSSMSDFVAATPIGVVACPAPVDPTADPAPAPTLEVLSSCAGDGTITLRGTTAAGTQVEVLEGITSLGLATVGTDGTTWTLAVAASDGAHAYDAVAHRPGHPASGRTPLTVVVDAIRPAAPAVTTPVSGGVVTPGSVTVSGTAEPLSNVEITESGAVVGQATADAGGTWSTAIAVPAGAHAWSITAADCAPGTASAVAFTASTGGNGATGTGSDTGGTGGTPAGPGQGVLGDVASDGCETTIFKVFLPGRGIRRVEFRVDGKKVRTVRRKDAAKRFVFRVDPALFAAGVTHRITARVIRRDGRRRTVPMRSFTRCRLGTCVSRRSFRIRVKRIAGEKVVSATVRVNGKKVKVVRGRRLTAPVVLAGLPKGKVTVRIVARTRSGRKVTDTRRYRTCVPARKKS